MKTALKVSAVALATLLAAGCGNSMEKEMSARVAANENATASAQARADEAYRKAEEALSAAQRAQQTADEANERAMRMLDKASQK
ncbi:MULTISPECIES: Lpp/OprI family alanine-zipper lipoprotein [Halopseudomonas]|jgi:hypothetical protein|uniref:Outer membrane lipoprotei OprI n=1 Tax=Halopseudomonas sabulinigri TaxID=472181 RepID=A0A1H1LTM2_9GAMM|nr:Lpp/OprI family alanine-zipper lipoprotein [Halopseudomonas sabulinigri]SDR77355.1 Protein of unknown function [Halopseudomonas sabulinigri]|tara:strand:- start:808 stop:1062 length:255 start_codon:yes stop_codon:yes gene_type:complete